MYQYDGINAIQRKLEGNGDFRSAECVELLKQSDVVVSNPPFSLFREYMAQLMEYDKKFLIVGNKNAITYKEIFPLIKENRLWLGISAPTAYSTPLKEVENEKTQYKENGVVYQKFGNHGWFTNIEHSMRNLPLDLYKKYNPKDYPKYDNYDAINVDKITDIPCDYNGVMGVPITFLDKYCPTQFEVFGHEHDLNGDGGTLHIPQFEICGKGVYKRILIRRKYPKYDNYDAINVDKTSDIPMDYDGVMGVPITFLDKYCPTQFEIVGLMSGGKGENLTNGNDGRDKFYVNGKGVYARVLIRRK